MIRKPHYDLVKLKRLIENEQTRHLTKESIRGGSEVGFSETEMVEIVLSLENQNFYKSMPVIFNESLWQDVYKKTVNGVKLYIKLQKSPTNEGVIISFKRDEEGRL